METLGPVYYILIGAALILLVMGIYIAYLIITTLLMIRRVLEKFEKGSDQIKKEIYDLKKNMNSGFFGVMSKIIDKLTGNKSQ